MELRHHDVRLLYLYTASVSRQIKSEDHQSEDGLFDEENEAVCSFIAEALL